ncbi:MAG: hypothetical protein WBG86_20405 [Polyangiales bacterium]
MTQTRFAVLLTLFAAIAPLEGCGGDEFSAICSLCMNDVPVGPSADEASCDAWGAEFRCTQSTLTGAGQCGDMQATCAVSDCATLPPPCTRLE